MALHYVIYKKALIHVYHQNYYCYYRNILQRGMPESTWLHGGGLAP